jgi:hypothetical protein
MPGLANPNPPINCSLSQLLLEDLVQPVEFDLVF